MNEIAFLGTIMVQVCFKAEMNIPPANQRRMQGLTLQWQKKQGGERGENNSCLPLLP
jgi:hypothetical protein